MEKQEIIIEIPNEIGKICLSNTSDKVDSNQIRYENYLLKNLSNDDNVNQIKFDFDSALYSKINLLEETEYIIKFIPNKQPKYQYYIFKSIKDHVSNDIYFKLIDNIAILNFHSYAGKTFLDIYDGDDCIFREPIEIMSKKIDYDNQYKIMIEYLASKYIDLLFYINGPLFQFLEIENERQNDYYIDFLILSYIFKKNNLPRIFEYLSKNLHSKLNNSKILIPSFFASNIDSLDLMDSISNNSNLIEVKEDIAIINIGNKYFIPHEINEIQYEESIDTIENQFFKFFIEYIASLINFLINNIDDGVAKDKLNEYKNEVNYFLSHKFFNEISSLKYIPLNSQILHKKEGYNDILDFYLLFNFGFKFSWNDLTENFESYQKQLHKIYEYWCYFMLIEILEDITDSKVSYDSFINDNHWSFTICNGSSLKFNYKDIYEIELLYNKFFSEDDKKYFSYSVDFRPDFTILFCVNNEIKFVHFDAKYKVSIKEVNKKFKNEDIKSMHAYRDAIKGTIGSYILYPGNIQQVEYNNINKRGYGVGAFPLNPNNNFEKNNLFNFIKEILENELELI